MDMVLFMGCLFCVGWGFNWIFVNSGEQLNGFYELENYQIVDFMEFGFLFNLVVVKFLIEFLFKVYLEKFSLR